MHRKTAAASVLLLLAMLLLPIAMPRLATAADGEEPEWSDPIDGLEIRLTAPRTLLQAWELPTFAIEVRNAGEKAVTAKTAEKVFGPIKQSGVGFCFKDQESADPDQWRRADTGLGWKKLVGLEPGETISETVKLTKKMPSGRQLIGLATFRHFEFKLTTNCVMLDVLPPGVQDRKGLKRFLKPYSAAEMPILAGFVPNKTTLVEGEPIFATFLVENPGDERFSFEFGGDYRGADRHNSFKIDVIGPDGKPTEDPAQFPGDFGGIMYGRTVKEHVSTAEVIDLLKYRAIAGRGKFKVTCRYDLEASRLLGAKKDFKVTVENSFELTILPRDSVNVQRALDEYFQRANQTGGWALDELIETISSFGQVIALPGLTKMGTEGDVEHRVAAAKGLGMIPTAGALEALLAMNRDAALEVRAAAIRALGAFTDTRAVETVIAALSEANDAVPKSAAAALGNMKTDAALEALIAQVPKSDPASRAAILHGMGISKSQRVFPLIVESLASQDAVIRKAALEAIVNYPPEEAAAALGPIAASHADIDFREVVARTIAQTLSQPIKMEWLTPVIKARKGNSGEAPTLMRLHGGDQAVPALLSCLDFEDPVVNMGYRNGYNSGIIEDQLSCQGALVIPWHPGAEGTEKNRLTLKRIKAWLAYCQTHPSQEAPPPDRLAFEEREKIWGETVDDLAIRTWVHRKLWPAGLPQVVSVDARPGNGQGKIAFSARPAVVRVEVNGEWYELPPEFELTVDEDWTRHHWNKWNDLQLDSRLRRLTDGQALDLKAGTYTVRVAVSRTPEKDRKGLAVSKPVTFEVIPSE